MMLLIVDTNTDLVIHSGISLKFRVAGRNCQKTGQIHCFIILPYEPICKIARNEGKVGGCFCRLPPLNENIEFVNYWKAFDRKR